MGAYYYQSRKKNKNSKNLAAGVLLVAGSFVLLASIFVPSLTGGLGRAIHAYSIRFSGWASFLIPLYLGWIGFQPFLKDKESKKVFRSVLFLAFFLFLTCLFSLPHISSFAESGIKEPYGLGGWMGDHVSLFLVRQFGVFLTFLLSAAVLFVCGTWIIGSSPLYVLIFLKEKIVKDVEDWKAERNKILERKALQKKLDKKPVLSEEKTEPQIDKNKERPTISMAAPKAEVKKVLPEIKKSKADPVVEQKAGAPAGTEPLPAYNGYMLPDPDLLSRPEQVVQTISKEELYANGTLLEQTLEQFHVKAKVVDIHPGPVITRYDLSPAPGVRVQAIETLANDVALAMKAQSIRVLAPVPGRAAVGIEIPNPHAMSVYLKELVLSSQFQTNSFVVPVGLGKTTEGQSCVTDLVSMPHLLIAGATGSGKSVCIHALILSILFRFKPDEVKLLLIDPKRLELPIYDGLPHLYDPASSAETVKVITQSKDVVQSLKKLIDVMDQRYIHFAKLSVRNIEGFNQKAKAQNLPIVPYIIVVIDELADLMITVGKEIEDLIQRLAQMARAVGIHLVLATQRPSVDVITGVIKANLPSRIAFQVLSRIDSRVILDAQGAEDLLGRGDMLFLATGAPKPVRLQGAFVSESDVSRVIQFIKEQGFRPQYESLRADAAEESVVDNEENRKLLVRAAKVVRDTEKVSGDLLRADKEVGSKYDLALILLKKRGLIEKPKDTNRWKIHFDRLTDFLTEEEKKGQ